MISLLRLCFRSVAALFLASTAAWAQPTTALWYQGTTGSIAGTTARLLQPPTDAFQFSSITPGGISLTVNGSGSNRVTLDLAPPLGQTFEKRAYESVVRSAFRNNSPGLDLSVSFSSCGTVHGRFAILELTLDSNFEIASFAANFEHRCETATGPATYGELRYNSTVPLTVNKPAGSTAPDPFSFAARTGVTAGALLVSNSTTIYGINAAAPIGVTGGEYSVNGGAFTQAPGTVNNRDTVRVRTTSSSTPGGTTTATLTVGGVASSFVVATYAPGDLITGLYYRSAPGEYVGAGATYEARAPDISITPTFSVEQIIFNMSAGSTPSSLNLATARGAPLAVGPYELAARTPFRGSSPGLDFSANYRGCNIVVGRFVVLDLDVGPGNTVNRFAANFEQWCEGSNAPLYGEIRYRSGVPFTYLKPASATTPDPFALIAQGPVAPGALVRSNWISIYGVNAAVPVSITGGEYSINGAPFTAQPGTAQPLDDIIVRLTASATPGATTSATLTAGGRSATLAVATYAPGTALTGIYYRSTSGDYIGKGATRLHLEPMNAITASRTYGNALMFQLNGTGGTTFSLALAAPGTAQLVPGTYEGAMRWPFQTSDKPGLNFSGNGAGCNQVAGRFVVREAVYNSAGDIERFAADFEQRCEITGPPLFGEVRYKSTVPFIALLGTCQESQKAACSANVRATQTLEGNSPAAGKDMVFTATATNLGPDVAYDAALRLAYDPSAALVWVSPGCVHQPSTAEFLCSAGTLASSASASFRLVLRKPTAGSMFSEATATTASSDGESANNAARLNLAVSAVPAGVPIFRYRLYSDVTKEHHYTTDLNEYNTLGTYVGTWQQEGTVGKVLDNPGAYNGVTARPLYRLYHGGVLQHHWTSDANEYYTLRFLLGWTGEGVDGYMLPSQAAGTMPLYRLYYPGIPGGLHHWTVDGYEYGVLIASYGWVGEGVAGYVIQ